MKRLLAFGLGVGLALGAAPALAQKGGRIMVAPSAPAGAKAKQETRRSAGSSAFKPTRPAGPRTADEMGAMRGPESHPKTPGFNQNLKPLYGVGSKAPGAQR